MVQSIGIVGGMRSGSTALGSSLALLTDGVHVGELHLLWSGLAGTRDRLCGCGEPIQECSTWQRVWERSSAATGFTSPQDADVLRARVTRSRRAVPGLAGAQLARRVGLDSRRRVDPDVVRFAGLLQATHDAVASETGAATVIDSSKLATYFARAIQGGLTFQLVHLIRDPQGVVASWAAAKPDPDKRAGAMSTRGATPVLVEWVGTNLLTELLLGTVTGGPTRIEDLGRDRAVEVLVDRLAPAGLSARPDPQPARERGVWRHTVGGNPLRFDRPTARLDAVGPPAPLGIGGRALVPILRRYGYERVS